MPAGDLKITFAALRDKGSLLMTTADDLQSQVATVKTQAQPEGIWEGSAADAYREAYERWDAAQATMLASLKEMGSFLQRAADAYEGTEDEVRRALGLQG